MKKVFADTQYWVALINDQDQGHPAAVSINRTLRNVAIFTSEEVLAEVLAYFSERGRYFRQVAAAYVQKILDGGRITVREQSHQTFLEGFALYKARPDKGYSLTDCVSMLTMRREGITDVLTHDAHFAQEGFTVLL